MDCGPVEESGPKVWDVVRICMALTSPLGLGVRVLVVLVAS
jgi:hypothetical protein